MAFRRDVAFMSEVEPNYMRLNGEEFGRVVVLINAAMPTLTQAQTSVEWESDAADLYRSRLKEAETLARELGEAFAIAASALVRYAEALAAAKTELARGDVANDALRALIKDIVYTQSLRVKESEPLSQWEDLRKITGWFDRLAEKDYQDAIDEIRPRAEELYYEAAQAYSRVRDLEREARNDCIAEMRRAFRQLPDFKADSTAAEDIIETSPGVLAEMGDAGVQNKESRLPGQGAVPRFGVDPGGDLSEAHEDIRQRTQNIRSEPLPEWGAIAAFHGRFVDKEFEQRYKYRWIRANRELIQAAAHEYGIPAEVLAGIVYQEVGGKPPITDHGGDWLRRHGLADGDPNDTSFGPMGIQVDTAAVALGYDPTKLTDRQREEIIKSVEDPKQSIMIAAKVLSDAKDASGFAAVEPQAMTPEQQRELAARYNGGPDWDQSIARGYADNYAASRDEVARELYGELYGNRPDGRAGAAVSSPPKFQANLVSINRNANILIELAGALGAGRPDSDLSRKGCMEALSADVTREIRTFADFAADQYQDVVALLSALSTKLRETGAAYEQADQASADRIARIASYLDGSRYVAPEQR